MHLLGHCQPGERGLPFTQGLKFQYPRDSTKKYVTQQSQN